MLQNILLVIEVLVCIALVGVILLQRSEGGALGMGSGPSGMFTARGAGDLLTRTTSILAGAFFTLALAITLLAGHNRATSSVTQRLKVAPADLSALAKAPAASGAPAPGEVAPPLPTTAPPLPGVASQAPGQAPRPVLHRAKPLAVAPLAPLAGLGTPPSPLPRPNLNQAPADQTAPAKP